METTKYQVYDGEKWITCTKAVVTPGGWLHYELPDGTNGLCRPKAYGTNWRQKPAAKEQGKA